MLDLFRLPKDIFSKKKGEFISQIDSRLITHIYNKESKKNKKLIEHILQYNNSKIDFFDKDERAFPADPYFYDSGYYHIMLKRYFFAGSFFCRQKRVLDSCSGLGWGTYILSSYAKTVTAFDIEEKAILFCKRTWTADNIDWIKGDALNISFPNDEKYDVVTSFETIEHFSIIKAEEYIDRMSQQLKKGGFFIGTSCFPNTAIEAETIKKQNPCHFHIFTIDEISKLLSKYFSENKVIDNWFFIGRK
ncbi:MAG TPA: class I SAM-dependent methyltransferase [bacterium]|nr:class I SAM-dependent methyltransferase [bacterium]